MYYYNALYTYYTYTHYNIHTHYIYRVYNRHMKIIVSMPYGHGNRVIQKQSSDNVLNDTSSTINSNISSITNLYSPSKSKPMTFPDPDSPDSPDQSESQSNTQPNTDSNTHINANLHNIELNSNNNIHSDGELDINRQSTDEHVSESDLLNDLIADDICRYTNNNQPYITINSNVPYHHGIEAQL